VVLEALASGVPAVVTHDGGPKTIVREGETGFIRRDEQFADAVAAVIADPLLHGRLRVRARADAEGLSWDSIFEQVCAAYVPLLAHPATANASGPKQRPLARRSEIAP
jgi:glycosyltransferase involved in cell wall biosynthesis